MEKRFGIIINYNYDSLSVFCVKNSQIVEVKQIYFRRNLIRRTVFYYARMHPRSQYVYQVLF